jgi:hypothetical protein
VHANELLRPRESLCSTRKLSLSGVAEVQSAGAVKPQYHPKPHPNIAYTAFDTPNHRARALQRGFPKPVNFDGLASMLEQPLSLEKR